MNRLLIFSIVCKQVTQNFVYFMQKKGFRLRDIRLHNMCTFSPVRLFKRHACLRSLFLLQNGIRVMTECFHGKVIKGSRPEVCPVGGDLASKPVQSTLPPLSSSLCKDRTTQHPVWIVEASHLPSESKKTWGNQLNSPKHCTY